jgi:putative tricarboxylic transport membrane protein
MGGFVWLVLGACFCIGSFKLKIGGLHNPGAGFIPFLVGSLLITLGLIMGVSNLFRPRTRMEERGGRKSGRENLKNLFVPFLTLLILVGYVILLEPLGFLLSTFIFLFLLFKISAPHTWLLPIGLSMSTVIVSYLLFSVWLQSQFPKGILGF